MTTERSLAISALEKLETALISPAIPPRLAKNCERLIEKLRRPTVVGFLGPEVERRQAFVSSLLGAELFPAGFEWPTIKIEFSEIAETRATLSDATLLISSGLPGADLFRQDVALLEIGVPLETLRNVSFLSLAASADADQQKAAMRWAAKKVDFAIWCTRDFNECEAEIWAGAPSELTNHSYLVAFAPQSGAGDVKVRANADFDRVLFVPFETSTCDDGSLKFQCDATATRAHLQRDINAAFEEDLDAARIFLHHFGAEPKLLAADSGPADDEVRDRPTAKVSPNVPFDSGMVDLLSEPIIYLKRRSRHLFETLDWQGEADESWPSIVLDGCVETTEGLRDLVEDWPDEDMQILRLKGLVEEASDMATLLRIEGGEAQAQEATSLLCQLRSEFEAGLSQPAQWEKRGEH